MPSNITFYDTVYKKCVCLSNGYTEMFQKYNTCYIIDYSFWCSLGELELMCAVLAVISLSASLTSVFSLNCMNLAVSKAFIKSLFCSQGPHAQMRTQEFSAKRSGLVAKRGKCSPRQAHWKSNESKLAPVWPGSGDDRQLQLKARRAQFTSSGA